MAMMKKGSRLIVVGEIEYRWSIRCKPSYAQGLCESPLTAAIELAESPGATLIVIFPAPRPDNWLGENGMTITPQHVASSIAQGLQAGWKPEQSGATQHLQFEFTV